MYGGASPRFDARTSSDGCIGCSGSGGGTYIDPEWDGYGRAPRRTFLCPRCGGSGDQRNPFPMTDELRRHVEAVWREIA